MKGKKLIALASLVLLALLAAACQKPASPSYPSPENEPPAQFPYPQPVDDQPATPAYPLPQAPSSGQDATPTPPQAVLAAHAELAKLLGLSAEQVAILEYSEQQWPDGCLGIYKPGQMCTQMIVPGYQVILEANNQRYEYRTDLTGRQVLLASPSRPQGRQAPILEWVYLQEGQCTSASIRLVEDPQQDALSFGDCNAPQQSAKFVTPERLAELQDFAARYAPFEAQTPAGQILFFGSGGITATPAEQRMLAEWARLVAQEAAAGRGGAAWGLAYAWHRQGGIAGFCDDLEVFLNGKALASSCKGASLSNLGQVQLTSAQLEQLYQWIDQFEPFEINQADPASTDAMTVQLIFTAQGEESPTPEDQQAIQKQIDVLWARLNTPQEVGQLAAALEALQAYFSALAAGDYSLAPALFAGDIEPLQVMNPDIDPADQAALFERYCTANGGVCNLAIKHIVDQAQLSSDRFIFSVELATSTGELFTQGPCCGEDPLQNPPRTRFEFTVIRSGDEYRVTDLPVYIP